MRRDEHHLRLCLLRGHDAERIRRDRCVVNAQFRDSKRLFSGDAQPRAVLRQSIIVVEQIGADFEARNYTAGCVQRLNECRLRRDIPGNIDTLCPARERQFQRLARLEGDARVIAIVAEPCGKPRAALRQGE
ncbi:hypothetical protein SDC9_144959 [bioreactor metagenome]|uniref:Uncharacterized protein n=1 Tax=bioreactor metagenome TaxID=1076179 RepID=A0A645EAW3_9ZZZZ